MHRYGGNIDFVCNLPIETGIEIINKAIESERDERYYRQWLVQLPFMREDTFVSFADYKKHLTGADIDRRPAEVILAEAEAIQKRLRKGENEYGNGNI